MSHIFSGIRPSGRLHLGNYLGAIKNWVALQDKHECIFAIVDYHAITTPFEAKELRHNIREIALDYLAVGLDPKKAALVLQSLVPEHLELAWIFSCISPLSWFEKVPTFKEKIAQHPDYVNLGLLAYPALMAADILIYKADLVPVGEDQLPHIELANKIGRRFNRMFDLSSPNLLTKREGKVRTTETFPIVKPLLTPAARIMSLKDPRKKMSKTDDDGIALSDSPDEVRRKIKTAVTDSGREILARENKPALANLLTIYSEVSGAPILKLEKKYKDKGYGDFKKGLAEEIIKFLEPIQNQRKIFEKKKGYAEQALAAGAARIRPLAQKNLAEVKKKMGLT